ncbi:hypothetical protein CC85DRAFT_285857 [Cutaneotrichosporon oleaginosum]|uniref:Transmembrane protein n=1 Tax=Cutaneotrichosporon oleaginosum TaxID=879819 RepID=A0A0J0XLU2_9TREE|nr:uncharacterized protein CC85DRAFT_285857 [Cutaneotrichosporon oleaginosum]KLT42086.1 hypothetical protein CC85DRAFT_285857 [Cutaneotrichosporon oleaginosum]TXT04675.1 hypothetical protein COLE_07494 [Cutaneotrichosporon oleaginosum]
MRLTLLLVAFATLLQVQAGFFSVTSYCKCICFSNSTIVALDRPNVDLSKPCLSCTRQFCLDQKLAICKGATVPELDTDTGTGTEGDVEARCFKRDSPRDQIIVTSFLFVVVGMLLFAGVRARLRRAIETRGQPTDLREWGEALLPDALQERILGYQRQREMASHGSYAPVSVGS